MLAGKLASWLAGWLGGRGLGTGGESAAVAGPDQTLALALNAVYPFIH